MADRSGRRKGSHEPRFTQQQRDSARGLNPGDFKSSTSVYTRSDSTSDSIKFTIINPQNEARERGAGRGSQSVRERAKARANDRASARTNERAKARGDFGAARQRGASARGQEASAQHVGRRSGLLITKEQTERFFMPKRGESDFSIIAYVAMLLVIGVVMITSSSYYFAYNTFGNSLYFFYRQLGSIALGLLAFLLGFFVPLKYFQKFSLILYLGCLFLCVLVLFIGRTFNGSTRWLGIGSLTFQPSETMKLGVAVYLAALVDKHQDDITDFKVFMKLLAVVLVPTAVVAYQNLSTGIIIAFVGLLIMFLGGARWKHFFVVVLPIAVMGTVILVLPLLIDTAKLPGPIAGIFEYFMYRTLRVKAWLDPFAYSQDEGYQIIQSLYAVGSGGFFGRGLGQSIQKLGYIPEAYNDIIFAIICEELGLFGAGIVILLFGMFAYKGVRVSMAAPTPFTCYLAAGITGQIVLQAILNIAVSTNLIPTSGVSLPFISYGGSAIIFLLAGVGMLLNVSAHTTDGQ